MSTYLVAYIVSDFDYKTADSLDKNNVTFRIWARKDALDQVKIFSIKTIQKQIIINKSVCDTLYF